MVLILFFLVNGLEGIAAFYMLASLPSDVGAGILFGFSASRLALLALTLVLALFFLSLALVTRLKSRRGEKWLEISRHKTASKFLLVISPLLILACMVPLVSLFSLYKTSGEYRFFAYYERLAPLLIWISLIALQFLIFLALSGYDFHWKDLGSHRKIYIAAVVTWLIFLIIWVGVALTGIGITPDQVDLGGPAVPLLEWQIALVSGIGALAILFIPGLNMTGGKEKSFLKNKGLRLDLVIVISIWVAANILWLSQPVPPGFFATPGRAPNYEIYPFSDGAYYASYAQSILVGDGFMGNVIPSRPLYILLLAVFHAIAGQNYASVIAVQTLFLAFFPVVLYFLGKNLHSRWAGITFSILAILREWNSIIATPFTNNISNSKLFFADLPCALAISLLALIVIIWLKKPGQKPLMPLAVGGMLGLTMLIRTQTIFVLPAILLTALIVLWKQWKHLGVSFLLIMLGLILSVSPYIWRNHQITGLFVFDDPNQKRVMAMFYSPTGRDNPPQLPSENDAQYSARLTQIIIGYIRSDPLRVTNFVADHFITSEIDNLLLFPVRDGLTSAREFLVPTRPFWQDFWQNWNGKITPVQGILLFFNLGILGLGIGASWNKFKWVGLLPLLINLSYNFSNALARNSGARYLLPVDWAAYFYYAAGLIEIALICLTILGLTPKKTAEQNISDQPQVNKSFPIRSGVLLGFVFLLAGSSLPLSEVIIPERYPLQTSSEILARMESLESFKRAGLDLNALQSFMLQDNVFIGVGHAFYPRFYAAGEGEERTAKTGYSPQPYPRLVFLYTSNYNAVAVFPIAEVPVSFPNDTDVIVIACHSGTHLEVKVAVILGDTDYTYVTNQDVFSCTP
jgi:hypothetical protein